LRDLWALFELSFSDCFKLELGWHFGLKNEGENNERDADWQLFHLHCFWVVAQSGEE
jgi:hypothetical protein